jgi:tetratricopeptide (TPR) repeat protein
MKRRKREPESAPRQAAGGARAARKETADGGPRLWHCGLAVFAALLIVLLAYGPALRGPFVFDDHYLPFTGLGAGDEPLGNWISGVRPLLMFTFWLNYRISGLQPYSYHLFNVIFHLVAGCLVFLVVRRLLGWAGGSGLPRDIFAAFAAGVFLLHPVQTESVSYVASRSETLSVMFFYGAFALFLYRRRTAISWPVAAGVLILFGAAVSTKEHAAVLPALLVVTDWFWDPERGGAGAGAIRRIRRNWRLYAPILAGGIFALRAVWNVLRGSDSAGFAIKEFTWYEYFFTQCRGIWMYVRLFFLPYGQNLDYDMPPSHTLLEYGAIFGLIGLAGVVAAALLYRRRYPLAAYGSLVFLLLLAPTSSFVPIADAVAERRLYLPILGLLLVSVEFLRRWRISARAMAGALAAVLAIFGWLTYQRNHVWGDEITLWQDAVAKSPRNERAHFQLAFAYYQHGRCDLALQHYETVAQLSKPDYRLLVDWALAYDCLGKTEEAVAKLQQAGRLEQTAQLYSLLGMAYSKQGRRAEALEALNTAERLDPGFESTYLYRGNLHVTAGELEAALIDYRRALKVNPGNAAVLQAISRIEARLKARR